MPLSSRSPDFSHHDFVECQSPIQHFVQVEAVHAHDSFSGAERAQAVITEAAVADEKPPRPVRLRFEFALKRVKVGCDGLRPAPLRLEQVGFFVEYEASVDLLATSRNGERAWSP